MQEEGIGSIMSALLSLSDAPVGKRLFIRQLGSRPDVCTRLRELGFCEHAVVRCISKSDVRLICEVCNTRIGLNASLADDIFVSQFE
jgi:ferrous iron transport protein A